MTIDSFVPMLETLDTLLDKGAEHAKARKSDLAGAKLAPDMYPLTLQVQLACNQALEAAMRLSGRKPKATENAEESIGELKGRIATTISELRKFKPAQFDGAEDRDCSVEIPGNMVIAMNGLQYLRGWALPNFYFHAVTAYDILRHKGVEIGKKDYLSQVGAFIKPAK
jgi:hypothetical protein